MEIEYYTDGSRYIKTGFVNDTVYFGGLIENPDLPDYYEERSIDKQLFWIYGTIQDSIITLTKDPIGLYWDTNDPDILQYPLYINPNSDEDVTLTIDPVTKKIGNLSMPFEVKTSIDKPRWQGFNIVDRKNIINMEKFPDTHQTPKAPVMTKGEWNDDIGIGCYLEADIFSTDNHMMPAWALYYKLYADGNQIDGKDIVFISIRYYIYFGGWFWDEKFFNIKSYTYPRVFLGYGRQISAYYDEDSTCPILTKVFYPFSYHSRTHNYDSLCEDYSTLYATLVLVNPDGTETESEPAYLQEGGIEGIATDREIGEQPVYDLTGRRVSRDNLAPGIYISGGQKFIVK